MAKTTKKANERQKYGKCEICLSSIPIQYYFSINDTIVCYQCGTEYLITSKEPIVLVMQEKRYDPDELDGGPNFG